MFLQESDYKKIENYLALSAKKDSDFPIVLDIDNNDFVTILLNGNNVRASVKTLLLTGAVDFLNVTESLGLGQVDLLTAINAIPKASRKLGLTISFRMKTGVWGIYTFNGISLDSFTDVDLWKSTQVNVEELAIDNDTIVATSGVLEVNDDSLKRIKLALEVKDELDSLLELINNINVGNLTITVSTNKSYVYEGLSVTAIITGNVVLPSSVDVSKVASLGIYKNDTLVGLTVSGNTTVSVSDTINNTASYIAKVQLDAPYSITKSSSAKTITQTPPIYTGVTVNIGEPSTNALQYYNSIHTTSNIYLVTNPVNSLKGKTVTFNITGNNQRVVVISSENNLGAKSEGFDFPFERVSIDNKYIYISLNTYSNQTQVLTFETKNY